MPNPIEFLISQMMNGLRSQAGNNPFANNVFNLAQKQDGKGLEEIANNILQQKGLSFDQAMNILKSRFHF